MIGRKGNGKSRMRLLLGVGMAAALLLPGVLVATSTQAAGSGSPFLIYADAALSGPTASFSGAGVVALNLAVKEVNSTGGLDGRKIQVHVVNDSGSATTAVSLLDAYLASGTTPNVILPGIASDTVTYPLTEIANTHHIIDITNAPSPLSTGNPRLFPYNFSLAIPAAVAAHAAAEEMVKDGYKSVAIMASDDTFGTGEQAAFTAQFKAVGIKVVGSVLFSDTALDFTPQLSELRSDNPDALLLAGFGTAIQYVLQDRKTMGWTIPVVGDSGVAFQLGGGTIPTNTLTGVTAQATPAASAVPTAKQTPGYRALLKALATQGPLTQSLETYSVWWDVPIILQLAAHQAGSTSTSALVSALNHLKAPKPVPWVSYVYEGFSTTDHFLSAKPGDLVLAPGAKLASAFATTKAQVGAFAK